MTWDGIPEHRNLRPDGPVPDLSAGASAARYLAGAAARQAEAAEAAARRQQYLDGIARRRAEAASVPPPDPAMPMDPFGGMAMGATAAHEMFTAFTGGGFSERQALYLVACLMHAGIAQHGGEPGIPPWPPERPQ